MSFAYILSKVWLVGVLAAYQGLIWAIVHFAATGMAGGTQMITLYAITLILVTFIGGLLGLMVSALSRTATAAANWLILLTIPQFILSGALIPVANLGFPFNFLS